MVFLLCVNIIIQLNGFFIETYIKNFFISVITKEYKCCVKTRSLLTFCSLRLDVYYEIAPSKSYLLSKDKTNICS